MAPITRLAAILGLAMAVGSLLPAAAFSADPASQPPQKVPQAAPHGGSGSSEALGDQLERSNGVIRPPAGVDPGLTQPPPQSGARTPVIRPPGTHGGNGDLNPK